MSERVSAVDCSEIKLTLAGRNRSRRMSHPSGSSPSLVTRRTHSSRRLGESTTALAKSAVRARPRRSRSAGRRRYGERVSGVSPREDRRQSPMSSRRRLARCGEAASASTARRPKAVVVEVQRGGRFFRHGDARATTASSLKWFIDRRRCSRVSRTGESISGARLQLCKPASPRSSDWRERKWSECAIAFIAGNSSRLFCKSRLTSERAHAAVHRRSNPSPNARTFRKARCSNRRNEPSAASRSRLASSRALAERSRERMRRRGRSARTGTTRRSGRS